MPAETRRRGGAPVRNRRTPNGAILAIAWNTHDPGRVGEVFVLGGPDAPRNATIGRLGSARPARRRPGEHLEQPQLQDPFLPRYQLGLRLLPGGKVEVTRQGQLDVFVDDQRVDLTVAGAGSRIRVDDRLLLVVEPLHVVERGVQQPHPFGRPDEHGIVGESAVAWELRAQLRWAAERNVHVVLTGESGVGKELAARMIHQASRRRGAPFVSRSAATIPESLADAELFGNRRDYPNPGMGERKGLIGEAHGGTLFLDEFGELPAALQARMLRVLDSGEYTRLGEDRQRTADVRVVAATNRPLEDLRADLPARIPLRVDIPPLRARRSDIVLVVTELARRAVRGDPALRAQLFDEDGHPRLSIELVDAMLADPLPTNVRQLDAMLWEALKRTTPGSALAPQHPPAPRAPATTRDSREVTREELLDALDKEDWNRGRTAKRLGIGTRHGVKRLMAKLGVRPKDT